MDIARYHTASASSLKSAIVRHLAQRPRSLADLQAFTGVSMPTLRRDVQELIAGGWIRRRGQASTGGRPARLYGMNGDSHLVIAVHLELPAINMAAVALDGAVLAKVQHLDNTRLSTDTTIGLITEFTRDVQKKFPARRILGVGVATPGFVDPHTGEILSIGRVPGWQQFPLRARLEAALALPVVIENDVDCMARAEIAATEFLSASLTGSDNRGTGGSNASNALYLGFSEGVKAAMLLDGRFYRGPFGNAGIIGRTLIPDPQSGELNYLEEMASTGQVCAEFERRLNANRSDGQKDDPRLQPIANARDHSARFQAILEAAAANEPLALAVALDMLDVLSIAAANLLHILQPGLLIIGGALGNLQPSLRRQFEKRLRRRLPSLISNHLLVRYARLGDAEAAMTGAATRFLLDYPFAGERETVGRV